MFFGLFSRRPDRGRQIFRFWDGSRHRYADPVEVWQVLEREAGDEWPDLLKTLSTDLPPAPEGADVSTVAANFRKAQEAAGEKVGAAVCAALGVKPLASDGSGLTRAERVLLAAQLLEFVGGLALAAKGKASSPQPTAASPHTT